MCLQPDTLVWYGVILLVTTEIDAAVLGDFQIRVILCLEVRRGGSGSRLDFSMARNCRQS